MLSEFVAVSLFLLTCNCVHISIPTLPLSLNLHENVCMPSESCFVCKVKVGVLKLIAVS